MDLDLRTGLFEDRLQASIGQLSTTFDDGLEHFTSAFDKRSGTLASKLTESLARISETVNGGSDSIEGILSTSIERLGST